MTGSFISALIVLHPFGSYSRGEMLTDPQVIAAVLGGGHARMVVRTRIPAPDPAPDSTEAGTGG